MVPEPPRNGGYLVAAYVVATLILVGYFWRLWRRGTGLWGQVGAPPLRFIRADGTAGPR